MQRHNVAVADGEEAHRAEVERVSQRPGWRQVGQREHCRVVNRRQVHQRKSDHEQQYPEEDDPADHDRRSPPQDFVTQLVRKTFGESEQQLPQPTVELVRDRTLDLDVQDRQEHVQQTQGDQGEPKGDCQPGKRDHRS
jgi:hypothetical protein